LTAHERGEDVIMLATRRHQVDQLNHAARQALIDRGRLSPRAVHAGGCELAVGDRVMTLRNWHRQGLTNGSRGTITRFNGESPTIVFDDGGVRTLPSSYLHAGNLSHAYAMTVHKAQGATVDRSLVLADGALFQEAGYTALSRGRHENRLYLITEPDLGPDAHQHARPQPPTPLETVARELSESHAKTMALELEPDLALEL
ncbi:MAG: hypothetical protein WEA81_07800, partial [Dehalococcoidia bacterium]